MISVPPGPRRRPWLVVALGYAFVMAASRVYRRTHWLTDVVAGVAFGAAAALTAVAVVDAWNAHSHKGPWDVDDGTGTYNARPTG